MQTAPQQTDMRELRERFDDVLSRLDGEASAVPGLERVTAALGQIAEIMRQDREELAAYRRELQVVQVENQELKGMLARLLDRIDTPRLAGAPPLSMLTVGVDVGRQADAGVEQLLARGNAARDAGRLREAAEAFGEATREDPAVAQAWADLALCQISLNRLNEAARSAATALGLDAGLPAAIRADLLVRLRTGDRAGAERSLATLRAADPGAAQTILMEALLLLTGGDAARALTLIDGALSGNPDLAEAHANRAQILLRLGRAEEALAAARRAGELRPGLAAVHLLVGNIERALGRLEPALAAIRAAITADPQATDGQLALIETLRLARRLDEALGAADAALGVHPGHAGLLCARATVLHERGDVEGAITGYRAALRADPGLAEANNNLAQILESQGRTDEAVAALEAAVRARPADGVFRRNLAAALATAGRTDEAETLIRRNIEEGQPTAEDFHALATVLIRRQRIEEALQAVREAVARDASQFDAQRLLATLLQRTGLHMEALTVVRRLVRRHSGDVRAWQTFAGCLEHLRGRLDPGLRDELLAYLNMGGVNHQRLAPQAAQLVRQTGVFQQLLAALPAGGPDAVVKAVEEDRLAALLTDRVFLAALERSILPEADMESVLTALRAAFLKLAQSGAEILARHADFLCALAGQCHNTEFVYAAGDDERASALALKGRVEAGLARNEVSVGALALAACYHPLESFRNVEVLARVAGPAASALNRLISTHYLQPAGEKQLRTAIRVFTPVRSQTSAKVRQQYELNPYPRWLSADRLQPRPLAQVMAALVPGRPIGPLPAAPEILIAGCGTGQEAIAVAQRFANSKVLAVDLSLNSLSHAIRKARELGIGNIEFGQADLLELGSIGRQFDIVESVGVLHHTEDTFASWRGLLPLVRPRGLMRIGLFSAIARRPISEARRLNAQRFPVVSADTIRQSRQLIRALPPENPLHRIAESHDFYSMSACRDLLFHVRESHHSLPEIADWLRRLELEFLAFEFADPSIPEAFRATGALQDDLAAWHAFETANPGTFLSMYQFWVRRS